MELFILSTAIFGASITSALFLYGVVRLVLERTHGLHKKAHGHKVVPTLTELAGTAPTRDPKTVRLMKLLSSHIKGDVSDGLAERTKYSRDTSVFERMPQVVVYPKDAEDVSALVRAAHEARAHDPSISVTARAAGTDMSGGPLTHSILAVFTKYMNRVLEVGDERIPHANDSRGYAVTEPGVYYRDFEKETLKKGWLLPSYPASRELCAMGGIVNNNSGGERTLEYGKTEKYVEEVEVVLSDGTITTFKPLTKSELEEKKQLQTLEGTIYRKMHDLLLDNAEAIEKARPKVSKNSAGYYLWDIVDKRAGTFNLAKLICGAQGTLALMTKARLSLVKPQEHRAMLIIFLSSLDVLPDIVSKVLPFNPESFESFDDHTLSLAVRFMPQMLSQMGLVRAARLGLSFLPELGMVLTGGVPKLILMAEFSEDSAEAALAQAHKAEAAIAPLHAKDPSIKSRIARNEQAAEKYWIVRRESFSLLRKHAKGMYAVPFIDDFVVPPSSYPQFLPELNALLAQYTNLVYTIAGHIGNGNFHIIPLMDVSKPDVRQTILDLAPKVYDLVIKYGGTTTGEHNDGIIRTPYLAELFGERVAQLFRQTKQIFDPENLFNPGKKVGGTFDDIRRDMITHI